MKKIISNKLVKSIGTLSFGSVLSSLITILIAPILTRIYTPNQMGLYTLVLTAVGLFGSVLCMRYEASILVEEEETIVISIIKISFIFGILISTLVSIGYMLYFIYKGLSLLEITLFPFLLFTILVSTALIKILDSYNNRNKDYKLMASMGVLRSTSFGLFSIFFGLLKFSTLGLLISQSISNYVGVKKQSSKLINKKDLFIKSKKTELLFALKKHKNQPIYSAPAIFASNFSYSSINFFIELLFGTAFLGIYSISYKILGLPLTIVSRNINRVFIQEASVEYNRNGSFASTFRKISLILIVLALPLFIGMYFVLPIITPFIFGESWSDSGIIIKILAPMFTIRFIVNSLSSGLQIVNKQKIDLFLMLIFSSLSIIIFSYAKLSNQDFTTYLSLLSSTYLIVYFIYYLVLLYYSKYKNTTLMELKK